MKVPDGAVHGKLILARLGDGNRAYKLFKSLLYPAYTHDNPEQHGSGTFPNLFCSHPPFQMDGNWGGTSGIGEMLLQSQDGFVSLLPAIPDSWQEGEFYGMKVRGGSTVGLKWKNGKVVQAIIKGGWMPELKIKLPEYCSMITVNGKEYSSKGILQLNTERDKDYIINFKY